MCLPAHSQHPPDGADQDVYRDCDAINVELLVYGGFEAGDPNDDTHALGWTAVKVGKDKRKCKAEKAYRGVCFYQFKDDPSEHARLKQRMTPLAILQPGIQLQLSGAYLAKGDP